MSVSEYQFLERMEEYSLLAVEDMDKANNLARALHSAAGFGVLREDHDFCNSRDPLEYVSFQQAVVAINFLKENQNA